MSNLLKLQIRNFFPNSVKGLFDIALLSNLVKAKS